MSSKEKTVKAGTSPIVLTIGHSTRTIDEFIDLLLAHGVSRVVDVRTILKLSGSCEQTGNANVDGDAWGEPSRSCD